MLKVDSLHKKLASFRLEDVSLDVSQGDYFVILGHSGAGKSLLLEIIAGLRKHDSGLIYLRGKDIGKEATGKRNIGLMFQGNSLFPYKTLRKNIEFPLKGMSSEKKNLKTQSLAQTCGIEHRLDHYPAQLSGGEIQRTILARTLAMEPDVLLLDEPLRSLDATIKSRMESLLRKLNREGQTIIHVTHDYREAMALAKHVAVIQDGKIIQKGKAEDVFHHPANEFVASFSGVKNYFELDCPDGEREVRLFDGFSLAMNHTGCESGKLQVIIPPESILPAVHSDGNFVLRDVFTTPEGMMMVLEGEIILYARQKASGIPRPGARMQVDIDKKQIITKALA
jgi:ABC-type Fe3+/spermidine/putrescine transport system ATPase subunit